LDSLILVRSIPPCRVNCRLAVEVKVTRGRKLRIDGTVVETHIHHSTDSSLPSDGVRMSSRLVKQAKSLLFDTSQVAAKTFRDRSRSFRYVGKHNVTFFRFRLTVVRSS
jgi:hypothetical protein